jgi:tyrosine-protein kinase Etk/Wzc
MSQPNFQIPAQEESDVVRALNLFKRNYKILITCVLIALVIAFIYNRIAKPVYQVSSSLLILKEERNMPGGGGTAGANEYINYNLFGNNQGFQNELYVLKSSPVVEQTVKNLDLTVTYYQKDRFKKLDSYKNNPYNILILKNHIQPVDVSFSLSIHKGGRFTIKAEAKSAYFTNLYTGEGGYGKTDWNFEKEGKFGDLVETPDLAFVVSRDSSVNTYVEDENTYSFVFNTVSTMTAKLKNKLEFNVVDEEATVIEIRLRTSSAQKGVDFVNELMNVYSIQNVNRKNHIAEGTISYIEKQLGEISDSLSIAETNLQQFKSSRRLLDVDNQASGMSEQYTNLQNQLAELTAKKRYYNYLSEYLQSNQDYTNIVVPTSMGVQDAMLNQLVTDLMKAQNERSNLIKNKQERNPMVKRLEIQIENTKKSISENVLAVQKTTDISIDELNKRIDRTMGEMSNLPKTQRQLGGIERKYTLSNSIYNYLLQKRAEAKISQASNLPDNIIIEPATFQGMVSPDARKNLMFAFALGLMLPYAFLFLKSLTNDKIGNDDRIDRLTEAPLLGKIPHTRKRIYNVVFENPQSRLAEAYRSLRTNLEYKYKNKSHKVILITSSIEGEGKSFNAVNLAMIYAQLGRRTLLLNFDFRKPVNYFSDNEVLPIGLSSYFVDRININDIIFKSPHSNLDFVPAGPVPPNPLEILTSDEVPEFINLMKEQYDCVILDTTPLAQVSDAYMLLDYADIKILVARYDYTLKKVFHLVMEDLKQKETDNLYVVMNDNRIYGGQYGYGYGYESNNKKKKKS